MEEVDVSLFDELLLEDEEDELPGLAGPADDGFEVEDDEPPPEPEGEPELVLLFEGWEMVRSRCTIEPTEGSGTVPVCLARAPLTVKTTVAPGAGEQVRCTW